MDDEKRHKWPPRGDGAGLKYGSLVVLYRVPSPSQEERIYTGQHVMCQCRFCEDTLVVPRKKLTTGHRTTCGKEQCRKRWLIECGLGPNTKRCTRCRKRVEVTRFTLAKSVCDDCRGSNQRSRKSMIRHVALTRGCSNPDCGWKGPIAYGMIEFHHKDKASKSFNLSSRDARSKPLSVVIEEIQKCITLCSNCHRLHHRGLIDLAAIPTCVVGEADRTYLNTQKSKWVPAGIGNCLC
jgi:hypothetical protein